VKLLTTGVDVPPGLTATAVTEAGPAGKLMAEVEKTPVGPAVTLTGPPTLPGPPVRVTTAFGVAVPEMVGVVVAVPLVVGERIATVGTGKALTLTGTLVVPPGPEAVTVRVLGPVGTVTGQLNVPDTLAVVVHRVVLPGPVMVIKLPGVAVPVMGCVVPPVGRVATVRLGGVVLIAVTLTVAGALTPPTLLVIAVNVCGPLVRFTVQLQLPLIDAVVVQSCPDGPLNVTLLPGVATPTTTGVSVVFAPLGGPVIATVGTSRAVTLTGTLVVPPGPEAVTVKVLGPTGTVTGHENVPETEAVVVQSVVLPGPVMAITLPGVAVPVMGWVVPPGVIG
jgi:hypothetical protein